MSALIAACSAAARQRFTRSGYQVGTGATTTTIWVTFAATIFWRTRSER